MMTEIFDPKFGFLKGWIIKVLKEKGIDLRPFLHVMSSQSAYFSFASAHEAWGLNSFSYRVAPYGVNMTCGMNMTNKNKNYIGGMVKKVMDVE